MKNKENFTTTLIVLLVLIVIVLSTIILVKIILPEEEQTTSEQLDQCYEFLDECDEDFWVMSDLVDQWREWYYECENEK